MLRAKNVPKVLSEMKLGGVRAALLVTEDGDILGTTSGLESAQQDQIVAAIMANVFGEYSRAGVECLGEEKLNFLLFAFEDGVVGMVNVCKRYHLCAYADASVNLGLLKRALQETGGFLREPMSQIDDGEDSADESKDADVATA